MLDESENGKNHPMLLSLEDNQIQAKVAINNFVEWHHEHSIKSLKYKDTETSRVQIAKDWMELSTSVRFFLGGGGGLGLWFWRCCWFCRCFQ